MNKVIVKEVCEQGQYSYRVYLNGTFQRSFSFRMGESPGSAFYQPEMKSQAIDLAKRIEETGSMDSESIVYESKDLQPIPEKELHFDTDNTVPFQLFEPEVGIGENTIN